MGQNAESFLQLEKTNSKQTNKQRDNTQTICSKMQYVPLIKHRVFFKEEKHLSEHPDLIYGFASLRDRKPHQATSELRRRVLSQCGILELF